MKQQILTLILWFCILLGAKAADREIAWGQAKNNVKICVGHEISSYTTNGIVYINVTNETTIRLKDLIRSPEVAQRFECILRDSNSVEVVKTDFGKEFGAKVNTSVSRTDRTKWSLEFLGKGDLEGLGWLKLDEAFVITKAGRYEMEVRPILLQVSGTNAPRYGKLTPIHFDPIKIKLDLKPNTPTVERRP